MVDRKLVGAHYGLRDWIFQRVTAVVMLLYTVLFLGALLFIPSDYEGWRAFFSNTMVRIITQIAVLALVVHAWIGVRDIWMDYVKPAYVRLLMHSLTVLWLLVVTIYSFFVIWGGK